MIFLDTSVLVPIAQSSHENHAAAFAFFQKVTPQTASTSSHALAELYAVLTRTPKPRMVSPRIAGQIVADYSKRLAVVSLDSDEVLATIHQSSLEAVMKFAPY